MSELAPYRLTISLNVLNHLGINLYSNVPAVLAEVVANSWDADARQVDVDLDKENGRITITDDGDGMSRDDVNDRFLNVGFRRRDQPGGATTRMGRSVMGRKGIGKLSLFSIAKTIEVHTVRDGVASAFRMDSDGIAALIEEQERARGDRLSSPGGEIEHVYNPEPLDTSVVEIDHGTRVVITNLKKSLSQTETALRKRLARRFSVIGQEHDFVVQVNGSEITVEDRDYFHKLEYLWRYGSDSARYLSHAVQLRENFELSGAIESGYEVSGWIGTVENSGQLKDENDNLNKIVVMVRGKVAQEDILEEFNEGGIYTKYLIGEVQADFLDRDDLDDIATSSRQKIIEDDPRYLALRSFLQAELKRIEAQWTNLRNKRGKDKALEIPAIKTWYQTLGPDQRRRAESLFGKINQLTFKDDRDRRRLFKHCVLAFESLRYKENLDALDAITAESLEALIPIFATLDDIEATLYHQIVAERIRVIDALKEKVEGAALEKVVQQHLYDHLWLLDPMWERATDGAYMEQTVAKEFSDIRGKLNDDEASGRLDIRYKKATGTHVIVELKRADRVLQATELMDQVGKYQQALLKALRAAGRENEPIITVCVVGRDLKDWSDIGGKERATDVLAAAGIRVVMYGELLDNAYRAYSAYLEQRDVAGRVQELIDALDSDDLFGEDPGTD